jgi:hypothetical protein
MARGATESGRGGRAKRGAAGPAKGTGAKGAKGAARKASRGKAAAAAAARAERRAWALGTGALLLGVLALRLAVNAAGLVPVHFDEAQYWAYGEELAWGYYSKPPGVAAAIRLTTELLGETLSGLRLASPLSHAAVGWLIFLTAARLWDGRTGFWAAAGYTLAPGVGVSALIVSTDPVMMVGWALALYAMVRAGEEGAPRWWWAVVGLGVGLGALAKYTALGFAAGGLAYGLLSARGRDWTGTGIAAGVALVVLLPNLLWNAAQGWPTIVHVAEDADPGRGYANPLALAEFLGAQLGVIGPVFFVAILGAAVTLPAWRADHGMRLMAWQTAGVLLPITVLAFVTRAQPNWAAPAYVAGSILAARWLLERDARRALLWGQLGLGAAALAVVLGLGALYDGKARELPRAFDPFKKMRIGEPFCARALGAMAEEGAEVLLTPGRRRLSECMFLGGLGWDRVAVWNPDRLPDSHAELVSTLQPGDDRPMLLATLDPERAREIAARFEEAREIDTGRFATHEDRSFAYALWVVRGFEGYGRTY